jgi:hypothetical protein
LGCGGRRGASTTGWCSLTVGSSPKEFEALIRADLERWSKLAGELGLEPQ